ncbi:hypothetical protein [Glaciecola sp. SC05]|uniref:hypothetical protein n=1 Tax=Glaciecola sp. SC05 TaxID=1987355 RepID=UPI0035272CE9
MIRSAYLLIGLMFMCVSAHAKFISNENISELSLLGPEGWEFYNAVQLFDGVTDRYTPTRFAAYQRSGADLSDQQVFNIHVALTTGVNVTSISFFNDWRHHLGQQVRSMNVSLLAENSQLLWHDSFDNLQQGSWDVINLRNFSTPVLNVKQMSFDITGFQGNHFEIRELLVGTAPDKPKLSTVDVSSPTMIIFVSVVMVGLMFAWSERKR